MFKDDGLKWYVARILLQMTCSLCLIATLLVSPWAMKEISAAFDTPGSGWRWSHLIAALLPIALLLVSTTARWVKPSARLAPFIAACLLLVLDAGAIVWGLFIG